MSNPLTSEIVEVDDVYAGMEYAWDQGWTDGLPVIPPTADRVQTFLDYAQLDSNEIIGRYEVRNRVITAEKLAINSVMAGCKPEYMPVLAACIEAVTDPEFHLNHIASTSSPWPAFFINGPITQELSLNNGMYVLGTGRRANMTIGRAISLTLGNCFDAKVGGVQQGTMGNPSRGMVVAENEDTPWEPLSVAMGFKPGQNVVTAFPTMENPTDIRAYGIPHMNTPEGLSTVIAEYMAEGYFAAGVHLILVSPAWQRVYLEQGWSKGDLTKFLEENTRSSVARLKMKGTYRSYTKNVDEANLDSSYDRLALPNIGGVPIIDPEDETSYVYHAQSEPRRTYYLIAVAGGDVGAFSIIFKPYPTGPNAVAKEIRKPGERN